MTSTRASTAKLAVLAATDIKAGTFVGAPSYMSETQT